MHVLPEVTDPVIRQQAAVDLRFLNREARRFRRLLNDPAPATAMDTLRFWDDESDRLAALVAGYRMALHNSARAQMIALGQRYWRVKAFTAFRVLDKQFCGADAPRQAQVLFEFCVGCGSYDAAYLYAGHYLRVDWSHEDEVERVESPAFVERMKSAWSAAYDDYLDSLDEWEQDTYD